MEEFEGLRWLLGEPVRVVLLGVALGFLRVALVARLHRAFAGKTPPQDCPREPRA